MYTADLQEVVAGYAGEGKAGNERQKKCAERSAVRLGKNGKKKRVLER